MSSLWSDARRMRLKKWGSLRSPNPVIANTDRRGSEFQALRILSSQYCIVLHVTCPRRALGEYSGIRTYM